MQEYFNQYALISIFAVVAIGVPVGMLVVSRFGQVFKLRPYRPTSIKKSAYEGGMRPFDSVPRRFNIRYYYFALLFVLFDIETVLLYPWAVRFSVLSREFGIASLIAGLVFLFVVTVGYVYAWHKKAVEWK